VQLVYRRGVIRRPFALLAAAIATAACTETPDFFPPCVDPNDPCVLDASSPASDAGEAGDATPPHDAGSGDGAATLDGAPAEGGAVDAALE
jgi:hypothetical protein